MDVIENETDDSVEALLRRPLYCMFASAIDGDPRLSPLWFRWEDETVWIIAQLAGRSYPQRVRRNPRSAVAVVDFCPRQGYSRHVGMRGRADLEPYDPDRARRLLEKYLGDDQSEWDSSFMELSPDSYRMLRFDPETAVVRGRDYDTGLT